MDKINDVAYKVVASAGDFIATLQDWAASFDGLKPIVQALYDALLK